MQLRAALQAGLKTLLEHHVPSAQLAAELLLMHVLARDRSYIYSHPEKEIPAETVDRYFQLIAERTTGKPTQYITGHQEFWGLDFEVTPDVLIPRPETEHVVETVLELLARQGRAKGRAAADRRCGHRLRLHRARARFGTPARHTLRRGYFAHRAGRRFGSNALRLGMARSREVSRGRSARPVSGR